MESKPNTAIARAANPNWREHLSPERQKLVQKWEKFVKNFGEGKATRAELLEFTKSFPPAMRQWFIEKKIIPADFYERLDWVEKTYAAIEFPKTPSDSQTAALFRIIKKRLKIDFFDPRAEYIFALFNIDKHSTGKMPLQKQSLKAYDKRLFALLKMTRKSEELPPLWSERRQIAANRKDRSLPSRLTRAFNKPAEIRLDNLLVDLQISRLQCALLWFWTELPAIEPRVGLCQFTDKAISEFLVLTFDSENKATNEPFDKDKIRDAIRRSLKLIRKKPLTITAFRFNANGAPVLTKR